MEVDTKTTSNSPILNTALASSTAVSLHPLVVLHVADHWARVRAQNGNTPVNGECRW